MLLVTNSTSLYSQNVLGIFPGVFADPFEDGFAAICRDDYDRIMAILAGETVCTHGHRLPLLET